MMRFQFVNIFVLVTFNLVLIGCETFHGITSSDPQFSKLTDKSCIEKAIKKTKVVEFESYEKTDRVAKTGNGSNIFIHDDIFRYKISNLDGDLARGMIMVSESKSEHPSRGHNYLEYSNSYGRINGAKYTQDQMSIAREAVESINSSVKTNCALSKFNISVQ